MKRKGLAVSIILLFIGVSIAPAINASFVKDNLVELEVELCGLGKKYAVELTQTEADELEKLFDNIEQKLSEVETREQTEDIFKDAVVELDKFGLLGGLSVKQAQKLVTGNNIKKSKIMNFIENKFANDANLPSINLLTLVFGHVGNAIFSGPIDILLGAIAFWAILFTYGGFPIGPILSFIVYLWFESLTRSEKLFFFNVAFLFMGSIFTIGLTGFYEVKGAMFYGFSGYKIITPENTCKFLGFSIIVNYG